MDRRTNRRTDKASYWVACTRLKTAKMRDKQNGTIKILDLSYSVQNLSFNVFVWLNILSLDVMLRRRLNVSGFFIFWLQGKKMFATTEKKWILSSKGTIHSPVKNGNWFFSVFIFFETRKWFHQSTTTDIPNHENKANFLPNFTISFESAKNMRERNLVLFCGIGWLPKLWPFSGDEPCHYLSFGTTHETFLGTLPWWAWK